MEQKRILIPNGNFSDWALINAAHRHGMYVIASGLNEDAPGNKFADEYVKADYSDKEAMLKLAKEKKIDYMVSNAHDAGTLSTAYVCEQLGLPGHDSYETTKILHTKDLFKPLAKKLGIHAPISEVFTDRESAIAYGINYGKKIIVKPADNVSSRGVKAGETPEEITEAVDYAFEFSKSHTIVIEPFLEGYCTVVTSMIINQEVVAFFADSNYLMPQGEVLAPEFPVIARSNASNHPDPLIVKYGPDIIEDFNKIARELKLVDGKLHCELMVAPDGTAQIYDIHRRMSGFLEPKPQWNYSTNLRWEDWILKAECGLDLSEFPKGIKQDRYQHSRTVYAPKDGYLKRMVFDDYLTCHLEEICQTKHFTMENIEVKDHRHNPITHVMLHFNTLAEAATMAEVENDNFYTHITFEYDE